MRILILGGTRFLGRVLAEQAVARGWTVTVFNRGRSGAQTAGVDVVHGDRRIPADLAHLAGHGPWDVVVDVPGVIPAEVRDAARTLTPHAGRYVFVSTVSAYQGWPTHPVDETSPRREGDPDLDVVDSWDWGAGVYGSYKAGAEAAVERETGGQALIVRPGVILGPWEYSGRLTWWIERISRGGRFIAPGDPVQAIQPVDVRDVAAFLLDQAAVGDTGVYNLAGPGGRRSRTSSTPARRRPVRPGSRCGFPTMRSRRRACGSGRSRRCGGPLLAHGGSTRRGRSRPDSLCGRSLTP